VLWYPLLGYWLQFIVSPIPSQLACFPFHIAHKPNLIKSATVNSNFLAVKINDDRYDTASIDRLNSRHYTVLINGMKTGVRLIIMKTAALNVNMRTILLAHIEVLNRYLPQVNYVSAQVNVVSK
jgi:hypothetical protein